MPLSIKTCRTLGGHCCALQAFALQFARPLILW